MLKIPQKYSRIGIKIKCLKRYCKWQISHSCGLTGKKISTCQHKDKHRYNLIVCIPKGGGKRKTRVIETKNFETAMIELNNFKRELSMVDYHTGTAGKKIEKTTVHEFILEYLDCISGASEHTFMNRRRSSDHVDDCRRVLERFMKSLKLRGYPISVLDIKKVGNDEVQVFHEYLLDKLKLGRTTYNKHFVIVKAFFNWVIRVKDSTVKNPFNHASLQYNKREKNIITKTEFEALLKVVTPENGYHTDKTKTRNYYKPWLKDTIRLALETGLRREELFQLKWSDLIQIENNGMVFRISNLKVNRIRTGDNEGRYLKHVPVTKSLKKLLIELGYVKKKKTDDFIIERPDGTDMKYLMNSLSRGFAHYIKLVTNRSIEFKDLRKTIFTRLAMALGDKCKLFTGHTQDEILQTHYISSAFLASNLNDFSVF